MRDVILSALIVAMLAVSRPLGERCANWLERRAEARLQRELAEEDALHDRLFSDPEFALAFVRQRFPEEHEMIAELERRAASAVEGAPWLPGAWSDERV